MTVAAAPRRRTVWLGLALLAALVARGAAAKVSAVRVRVPDEYVLDQAGNRSRFLSDVIGERVAAITFTYTSCTTICPVLDGIFQQLQGKIADRLGDDAVLITLSVDPVTDTPARLQAHAEKMKAGRGWVFLTGAKNDVTAILKGMDVFTPDILNHPPSVFVVDGQRGVWSRFYGFPSAGLIRGAMLDILSARGAN